MSKLIIWSPDGYTFSPEPNEHSEVIAYRRLVGLYLLPGYRLEYIGTDRYALDHAYEAQYRPENMCEH